MAIGLTLDGVGKCLRLDRPARRLCDGPRRPVSRGRRPALEPAAHPRSRRSCRSRWSLVLLWTASFERILLYSGVGLAIFSMLTVSAVYVLRAPPARPPTPVLDAWLSDRAGRLSRRDRHCSPRPFSTSGPSSRRFLCSASPSACRSITWASPASGVDLPLHDNGGGSSMASSV